ncbi:hypothetical protein [Thiocystis violascens]|uniref:Uncharacterized protein n=1 Tax=Thiocystis violascens (strain ATCC 17096 / DSM 198 / 6111) TaxID=765911 RepID=I3YEF7_THIV6|nr:hypothetical protein [Thiocystis violascens]AFL75375.1 hypothetical protein Thivi_3508 [Thiocystis violascens DSM 198]
MMTIAMHDAAADPAAVARFAALLPMMDERYRRLKDTLRQAAAGETLPDWQIALHRADLLAVLDTMTPSDPEDDDRSPPVETA